MNNLEKITAYRDKFGEQSIEIINLPKSKCWIVKTSPEKGIIDYHLGIPEYEDLTLIATIPEELSEELDKEIKKEKLKTALLTKEKTINKYKNFFKEFLQDKILHYEATQEKNTNLVKFRVEIMQTLIKNKINKKIEQMKKLITQI